MLRAHFRPGGVGVRKEWMMGDLLDEALDVGRRPRPWKEGGVESNRDDLW